MNVIKGRLDWLRRQDAFPDDDDDDLTQHLDTVDEAANRLVALSEKARHVDRTLESVDRDRIDLDDCLTGVLSRLTDRYPDLTVTVETPPTGAVAADGAVRVALKELLATAADTLADPTVSVSVETDERYGVAAVEVVAEEPFVPAATCSALHSETEASLQHATGLGIWVVQWVTETLNGTLRIPDEGAADRVRLTVPIVSDGPVDE